MNLFNILKIRTSPVDDKLINILPYEIPPLYKMFLKIFDFSCDIYFSENFIDNKFNFDGFNIFYLKYLGLNLQIQYLFNEKNLVDDFESYLKHEDVYYDETLVRIGLNDLGGGIFLGCDPLKNFDQIFIYFWDDNELIKCANNIFEFASMIHSEVDQYQIDILEGNPSNLYKNWNEDFWRIKPPEFRDARPYELLDKSTLDKKYLEMKKQGIDMIEIEYEYKIRGFDWPKSFFNW